ncbi:MAG: O-antigen ligase family protein [Anaerolineales bacterium]|nr:O-antigen ligase family protein [Anaerolineales bacterium]
MKRAAFSSENLEKLARILWAATLLTLPVTSFRYFPRLGETTYVRPLAFYPLVLLLPILLIQLLRKKISSPWPGSMLVLGMFLLVLLAATMFGVLHAPLDLRGQSYWGRAIRAWATVIIGLSFFVTAAWMNRHEDDLKFSVRWLLAGFLLDIVWSGVQALAFYTPMLKKVTVTHWQLAFSMRELVKTDRVSGLAYEPAWLAGQIATVYLPWLFAAVLTKMHFTRFKWLEALLLGLSGLLLLATYSRGGLVTALGAAGLTFLLVGGGLIRSGWRWFYTGFKRGERTVWRWLVAMNLRFGLILAIVAVVTGAFLFLGQKGYMARLWNSQAESLEDFIIENSAGARAAYNWAGLATYNEHPWLGVGLGASGFYMYDNLPNWALTTVPEIARQLAPSNRLYPNPKNMYVRVLAEGGLLGFSLFLAFLFGLLGDALSFLRKPGLLRFLGIAGLCSWLAILLYNITQDSFATPNIWVNLGILAGMSRIHSESALEERA